MRIRTNAAVHSPGRDITTNLRACEILFMRGFPEPPGTLEIFGATPRENRRPWPPCHGSQGVYRKQRRYLGALGAGARRTAHKNQRRTRGRWARLCMSARSRHTSWRVPGAGVAAARV